MAQANDEGPADFAEDIAVGLAQVAEDFLHSQQAAGCFAEEPAGGVEDFVLGVKVAVCFRQVVTRTSAASNREMDNLFILYSLIGRFLSALWQT